MSALLDQYQAVSNTAPKTQILIVEDERIVALHLRQRLATLGYEVSAAVTSGGQALQEIHNKNPDLILMDIHIEGDLDGIETTRLIPAELQIPVIYLTAYSEEATLEMARATHPYGYLLKPFSDRELHATIQMALERRKVDRALRKSEERLSTALDTASKANHAKSDFLAVMSHELRTPMNAILGFGQLLDRPTFGDLNPRQHEYVSYILQAGKHLLNLINDLLDLSKIEAAQLHVTIDAVELAPLARRVAASLAPLAAENEIELALEMHDDLAAAADATRLSQVLINLVSNAIKYGRPGGSVRVSDEMRADGWLRITVADNGIGIPPERQREVFEPFNRLGAEFGRIEGSGIGLPIAKRLVEIMGGYLEFQSTPGVGSQFWIELPAYRPPATSAAQYDLLTGLPNRMLLNDRITQAIALAPRHTKSVAVLSLNLDGFQHINESMGRAIGDKLLQSIAKRLEECVRRSDTVSRQDGDEFVVLLSAVKQSEDVMVTARRMRQAVAEPHSIDGHDLRVSASVGISVYPEGGLDASTLIENANAAMRLTKEMGRRS
jgi:diguanylate cyclase (GGDEF)-like protein